jgi:two-component system CheB/CheR fusion protein
MRVLIVEDHADSAEILSRILQLKGHDVKAVGSCQGALQACSEQAFDLLIADIGLPDFNGWELLKMVREKWAIKAIAVTGYGMSMDVNHSRTAGFDRHFTKPINITELNAAIMQLAV